MLILKISAGWDLYVLGLPLLGLLFFGYFKLDEVFAGKGKTSKPGKSRRPPPPAEHTPAQMKKFEVAMQSDPDGRSWSEFRASRR